MFLFVQATNKMEVVIYAKAALNHISYDIWMMERRYAYIFIVFCHIAIYI